MNKRINEHGYKIADCLHRLVNNDVLPGLHISSKDFWQAASAVFDEFIPKNNALLATRNLLQTKIDNWHLDDRNTPFSQDKYQQFLTDIGYLIPEQSDFQITTDC